MPEFREPLYWILDDNKLAVPVDLLTWGKWFEDFSNRRVAETFVNDVRISTAFMGIDLGFDGDPPLLFETMTFGGDVDLMDRYPSWQEAEAGHKRIVAEVEKQYTDIEK